MSRQPTPEQAAKPRLVLTHEMVRSAAVALSHKISRIETRAIIRLWGIPRGGVFAAFALIAFSGDLQKYLLVDTAREADVIIDDIVDTCRTREQYRVMFPRKTYAVLFDKFGPGDWLVGNYLPPETGWIVFPWEVSDE